MKKKVVLAYSGGLDTSACVPWLKERGYEVVCFMADLGQEQNSQPAVSRGKKGGAQKVIVSDLKREFAKDYIWPALKANALYEGRYSLATALSRPLIAKELVRIAHLLQPSRSGLIVKVVVLDGAVTDTVGFLLIQ